MVMMLGAALTLTACFDDKKDAGQQGAAGTTTAAAAGENNAPAPPTERRADVGAPFGSAGPRKCPDAKQPLDGPPSKAQAATYVACETEGQTSDMLYLVGDVQISEIGASRRYAPVTDINMPEIDSRRPIYPILGSFTRYQCRYLAGQGGSSPRGANCVAYPQPEASGSCYVNAFGNWRCSLLDTRSQIEPKRDVAPPA